VGYGPVVPLDLAERVASEDHATLWAKTIALAARNGVEDLHAAGAFSDGQAPALNRWLRGHVYEVLMALRRMDARRVDDPFTAYLVDLIDDEEEDWLRAALKGAVSNAVREFADPEAIDAETAARLEQAAVDGALEVVELCYSLDQPDARRRLAFLISSIPGYWEPPQLSRSFSVMFEDRSAPARRGTAR
jgi:hypothetical protein